MNHARQLGFTFSRMPVALTVIAVVAFGVSLFYRHQVAAEKIAQATARFSEGVGFVENQMRQVSTSRKLGKAMPARAQPDSTAGWLTLLNATHATSPTGTTAYAASADANTGVIGVAVTKGTFASQDIIVRLDLPAYESTAPMSQLIDYAKQ